MRKLLTLTAAAAFVAAFGFDVGPAARAAPPGLGTLHDVQSDYLDMDPPDSDAYCGVDAQSEPWTLRVTVSNRDDSETATFRFEIQDGTGTRFDIPPNTSFSFSMDLVGAPFTGLVRLSGTGDGLLFNGMATVRARKGATDPFIGDGRDDNFCTSISDGSGGGEIDDLTTISTLLVVPNDWVVDNDGSNGGLLNCNAANC